MIYVAIGGNLAGTFESPRAAGEHAVARLAAHGMTVVAHAPWYETAPVPLSDQPWYVNSVVAVESTRSASDVMTALHHIERIMGRVRGAINGARVIDLDLLDYHGAIDGQGWPMLPHPRLADRAFVLYPLEIIAPAWRHPVSGKTIATLMAALPPHQAIRRL